MRTTVLALLLCTFAVVRAADTAAEHPADKAALHLFVLMGQSNMAGSGTPVPLEYYEQSAAVVTPKGAGWVPARVGPGQKMGPGLAFARLYAELHPGVRVGIVQCARSARGIKELSKGGKDRIDGAANYDQAIASIKRAQTSGTVKAVLWHQGETDCGDGDYNAKLTALVADLRADLGEPDLPFIAGQIGRFGNWGPRFNDELIKLATAIPHCGVVTSEGLSDLGDKLHFSGFSVQVLGARYLEQYLRMQEPALSPAFAPRLESLSAAMAARDAGWDLLLNGDFSEGATRVFAWEGGAKSGKLEVSRDTVEFASAPAALRLASAGAAQGGVSQTLRNVAGKTLRVSAKIRNDGFTSCQVVMSGIDHTWNESFHQVVLDGSKAAASWQTCTAEVAVPANLMHVRVSISVAGTGTAWVDDLAIERVDKP